MFQVEGHLREHLAQESHRLSQTLSPLPEIERLDNRSRQEHLARLYTLVQRPEWEAVVQEFTTLLALTLQEFESGSGHTNADELRGRAQGYRAVTHFQTNVIRRYNLETEKSHARTSD